METKKMSNAFFTAFLSCVVITLFMIDVAWVIIPVQPGSGPTTISEITLPIIRFTYSQAFSLGVLMALFVLVFAVVYATANKQK